MKRVKVKIKRWKTEKVGKVVLKKYRAKKRKMVLALEILVKGGIGDDGAFGC